MFKYRGDEAQCWSIHLLNYQKSISETIYDENEVLSECLPALAHVELIAAIVDLVSVIESPTYKSVDHIELVIRDVA